ncbi:MAG: FAD-dependent monooxygenase [Paracoccaceae bacterium]
MEQFHKGRVIFAGDSAHQVSPFGARGANSGLHTDNLAWKLKLIIDGTAPVKACSTATMPSASTGRTKTSLIPPGLLISSGRSRK